MASIFNRGKKQESEPNLETDAPSRLAEINGDQYAIGLHWSVRLAVDGTVAESQKTLVQDLQSPIGASVANDIGVAIGVASKNAAKSLSGKVSAAVMAAMAVGDDRNVILIEPIDGESGEYWLCAVQGGLPNAHSDQTGSLNALRDEADALMAITEGFEILPAGSLAQLVSDLPKAASRRARIGKISNIPVAKILLLAVALAIAIGGVFGYQHWQNDIRIKKLRQAAMSQIANPAEQEKAQQEAMKKDSKLKELSAMLAIPSPKAGINAWMDRTQKEWATVAGWELASMKCVPGKCDLKYRRSSGTLKKLQAKSEGITATLSDTDTTLKRVDVPFEGAAQSINDAVAFSPEKRQEVINLIQTMGNAKVVMKFDEPATEQIVPYETGKFQVSGTRMYEIRDVATLLDRLALSPSLVIKGLDIDFAAGKSVSSWKMEGLYVFKK